jgi:hypothetical protein
MANALYDGGREGFLDGSIDWDTDDIRVMGLTSAQAFSAAHKFVSDLTAGNIVVRAAAGVAGKTVTAGVANHSTLTLSAVTGSAIARLVYYKFNASDAAARLICYIDTATGLPVTPNGGDITVTPDTGANKLFKL